MWAEILSPSKIEMYLGCAEKYWHAVENHTSPQPSSGFAVGSCFHNAIERYVDQRGKESFEESVLWANSHVEAYPPAIIRETLRIGRRWLNHNPLPSWDQIHGTEISFGPPGSTILGRKPKSILKFKSGLQIRGIIDVVWIDGKTIVVGDYKTQWASLSDSELSTKVQAMAYALAVHQFAPNRPIRVEFYMIRYPEKPVVWVPEEDDFEAMEKLLYSYQRRISLDVIHKATPGRHCEWCDFNYTCKPFDNWQKVAPPNKKLIETMDKMELSKTAIVWQQRYKAAEKVYERARQNLQEAMERENLSEFDGWEFTRKSTRKYDKKVQHIVDHYGGHWKMPPNVRADLKQHSRTSYGSPYLRRRRGQP